VSVGAEGAVVIPAHLTREVLRLLTLGLTERARRDGLPVSTAGRSLLWELAATADQYDQEPSSVAGTSVDDSATVGAVAGIASVAARMGCSEAYARRLARQGRLDATKVGGRWIVREGART
jgi:hypothetical protein